jgi:hypothetical protein
MRRALTVHPFERGSLVEVAVEIERSTAPGVSRGSYAGTTGEGSTRH